MFIIKMILQPLIVFKKLNENKKFCNIHHYTNNINVNTSIILPVRVFN